ncbi:nucleoside deaminase [Desulfobacula toluolica]|uniref:CMP/dCMP deaminase zinc-binding n=1 Tax=Desulfobacula toluolica (strain DSM 7467 / Tol2) TaxID=651182 RepID=K0NJQ8_DESTT|nr:deaminase [Desulfobacula toluolica]CCK79097.1 CMP/dCMP deaminase zinc-binding [Desulfobacula toluolica Tol2]
MIKRFYMLFFVVLFFAGITWAFDGDKEKLITLEKRIASYSINNSFKDDLFGLAVVKNALVSIQEGSGGIGACLVDSSTGKVVEYGRNRQYTTYFRSDLHAEMDLLNRYEDRVQKKRTSNKDNTPRDCKDLVLITSVEPCPMCLTRIINSGIKTVLYVVEDKQGGMATRIDSLPPFWRKFAADREFRQADCSPEIRKIAHDLFHFSHRNFVGKRVK